MPAYSKVLNNRVGMEMPTRENFQASPFKYTCYLVVGLFAYTSYAGKDFLMEA